MIDGSFVSDDRGGFFKYFERDIFANAGIEFHVSEVFSTTNRKNVIRGMHFQRPTWQAKIVTVLSGCVIDHIVDLRKDSPTYLKNNGGVVIRAEDRRAILVPRGFAHGFIATEDDTVVTYLCDGRYIQSEDGGVRFDDPTFAIKWPIDPQDAVISPKDRSLPFFDEDAHSC